MANSGVKVAEEVKDAFTSIKTKQDCRYVIFKMNDTKSEIVVDRKGDKSATFDMFKAEMFEASRNKQGRYAIYDFTDEDDTSGRVVGKLCLISWIDDSNLPVKEKMLYASSKDALKKVCEGIAAEINFNDEADFDFNEVKDKVMKKKK